ncbi:MAG: PKD domain-containing protein, partial [Promethearchaeota archaeon]
MKNAKRLIHVVSALILVALLLSVLPPQPVAASDGWWDASYQYRRRVTVSTGANSPYNGYAGYTVEITMDTMSPNIQDDGEDLRVVWWDGSGWQELDRHIIDPDTASTIIRFRLQADIAASSNDDNYFVYYGNADVGAGPANLENVYLHYNNHSTDRSSEYYIGRLGIANWHGDGDYSSPYDGTNQRVNYDTGDNYVGEWVIQDIDERDVYLECQMRDSGTYPYNTTPGLLARIQWATLGSSISDFYAASNAQGPYNESGLGRNARTALTSAYDPAGTKYYSNNTIYRFYFAVWGTNPTGFKADFAPDSGQLQWKPGATPYVNGSSTEASELESSGQVGFLVAQQIGWMDEFMARRYTEPEPNCSLAAEETVTAPTVTTNETTNITTTGAKLNADLTSFGTASMVDVSFQWGTSSGAYTHETTPQSMTTAGAFDFDLSDLKPGTTYYFKAKADSGKHGTGYGAEKSFRTLIVPVASFSAQPTAGEAPLTVQFRDMSTGDIESWSWRFGDGQGATGRYVSHTFQNEGIYDVVLTVTGPGGRDTASKTIIIEAMAVPARLSVRNLQ